MAAGFGLAAAYVGYETYLRNEADQQDESERIRLELEQNQVSLVDQANELSKRGRWNGPGVPALGLDPESIDATSP